MKKEIEIIESIEERIALVTYEGLTEEEQNYHAIWWLEGQANNGGFEQFFYNCPSEWASIAQRGLHAVGATKMASFLDAAISIFPEKIIPENDEEKQNFIKNLSESKIKLIDNYSNRFTDYPDPLNELLEKYYQNNIDKFPGPKTLLDLWHSKNLRGADTTPRYVTKNIDFKVEAEKDKKYSTRSCPKCEYPTPDYKTICKRCGYPHGKA